MSKPSHSRRDWTLFGGAALVPAIVVGALGLRALSNEEATQRRATSEAIAAEAVRLRSSLERGLDRAGALLEDASEQDAERTLDAHAVYEALRADAPPALEPVVLSADGRILEPAAVEQAAARERRGKSPPVTSSSVTRSRGIRGPQRKSLSSGDVDLDAPDGDPRTVSPRV